MQVRVQNEGLAPRVQRGDHARVSAQIFGVPEQRAEGIAHGLKQQRAHHGHVGQPEGIEVMGQRDDHVIMVTGQQSGLLEGEPALGLEVRTLGAGAMPTRVVPDTRYMAGGALLHMAA